MLLRTSGLIALVVVLFTSGVAAFSVGFVLQVSDDSVTLVRTNVTSQLTAGTQLLENDVIQGDISRITMKLHPYARVEAIGDGKHQVIYAPKKDSGIVAKLADFFGFVRHEAQDVNAATRNSADIMFSPGKSAAVIPGQPLLFKWIKSTGRELVITDSARKEVFRRYVGGSNQFILDAEQTKTIFVPGQMYQWTVTGQNLATFELHVPDERQLTRIHSDLASIETSLDASAKSKADTALYFTLLSDTLPAKQQLYWLAIYHLSQLPAEAIDTSLLESVQKRYYETIYE